MTTYSYYEHGVCLATGLSQNSAHRQCDLGGGTAVPEIPTVETINAREIAEYQRAFNQREMNARRERELKALNSGVLKAFNKYVWAELRGVGK